MLQRILNRRSTSTRSDFEHYLREVENIRRTGHPSVHEAKRDYQATLRSRNPFMA